MMRHGGNRIQLACLAGCAPEEILDFSVNLNPLGIPDGVMPLCVVPVGFPAGDERPKDKWDPSRIHRNRF